MCYWNDHAKDKAAEDLKKQVRELERKVQAQSIQISTLEQERDNARAQMEGYRTQVWDRGKW